MSKRYRFTPERISSLKDDEVFVFGSNLDGRHGGGAARIAHKQFGAVWGEGKGLHGQSYAIPSTLGGIEKTKPYVDEFISFARQHKELTFLVTRIGCGNAGFKDEEMAPLFADALKDDNIILPESFVRVIKGSIPKVPKYLTTKVHGMTATLVDMVIELNKKHHFTSSEKAFECLKQYIDRIRTDGDKVAFECSIRSLKSCVDDCFNRGNLDVALLQAKLHKDSYHGIEKVYMEYVVEKTVKLVEVLNEIRHYTNAQDVANDFLDAIGHINPCGPQPSPQYYFAFVSPCAPKLLSPEPFVNDSKFGKNIGYNFVQYRFRDYLERFWSEFAPNGTLNNLLFRDFMINRHQRGIVKYGLDAVIEHNYRLNTDFNGTYYDSYRGGAGPVYIRDEENRKWIKACGAGSFTDDNNLLYEYFLAERVIKKDKRYKAVKWNSDRYYIPIGDTLLPVILMDWTSLKIVPFKSEEEKMYFIKQLNEQCKDASSDGRSR